MPVFISVKNLDHFAVFVAHQHNRPMTITVLF